MSKKYDKIFENLKNKSNEEKKRLEDTIKELEDESNRKHKKEKELFILIQKDLVEDIFQIKKKISEISEFIDVRAPFLEKHTPIASYVLAIEYSAVIENSAFGNEYFNKEKIWIMLETNDEDLPQLVLKDTMDGEKMRINYLESTGQKILEDYFTRIAKWLLDYRLKFKKLEHDNN